MKKSLLALAVIGFAGAASAQSSVTLFGIVDAGVAHLRGGGDNITGMTNSGLNSSRLGFRGIEDLGGGLQAGFWLEGQLSNDTGTGPDATSGLNFQRRSTVSLIGRFGEIRLGRDYVPTFWNLTVYDPFGTNGVGQSLIPNMLNRVAGAGHTSTNGVRANNSVGYFAPAMGGFNLQVMYAFGENDLAASPADDLNRYVGARVGYAAGPLAAHVAWGRTDGATNGADTTYINLAGSFDLGVAKPMLVLAEEKTKAGVKVRAVEIGATAPLGQLELRAAFSYYDVKDPPVAGTNLDWRKLGIGAVYNLSKRSAMYATYAVVDNRGRQTVTVSNNGLAGPAVPGGGNSRGIEVGVRHIF